MRHFGLARLAAAFALSVTFTASRVMHGLPQPDAVRVLEGQPVRQRRRHRHGKAYSEPGNAEAARRVRQIAAGRLTAANGLVV
ncbi:hypothetical protein K32_24150 [Kaistia sp. 32K]|uniref:hypothetical protein n=1 Tax=Kaistia sp. 32K TaxID=2795690 RepID=UPI001914FD47|nr:hypothetical protein [Kaistia sp. 32K]BCP53798.1 hypothetical protein K32_24150 [Kaistia sp. 32K]